MAATSDEPIPRMEDSSLVETPKPPEPARMQVTVASDVAGPVTVNMEDASGASLWRCERRDLRAGERLDAGCPIPDGWSKAESMTFLAQVGDDAATQSLRMHGDELSVEVVVEIAPELRLVATRVRPAPKQFRLERRFAKPWHHGLPLTYAFVNGDAKRSVEAEAVKGHFLGVMEMREGGTWVPHGRGTACEVEHGDETLAPGSSGVALEGHFVGVLRPFIPGTYRFRLRFRDAASQRGPIIEAYELHDEVYVSKSSNRPETAGADCDSPFAIDRWGLRRMKPECL